MSKLSEKLKEEMSGCDYYSSFIKDAIRNLKINGICYVYHKEQVDEIIKYVNAPVTAIPNECGYTLSIPRKYRMEVYYE